MALKKLPGGVIVETDGGARLNESAGVNLEAIHRQIIAGAPVTEAAKAEADRAEAAARDAAKSASQAAGAVVATPPGSITDLDDFKGPGYRSLVLAAEVNIKNHPSPSIRGIVQAVADSRSATQGIQTFRATQTAQAWSRAWYGSTWTAWAPHDLAARPDSDTTALSGTTPLESLTAPGRYAVASASVARSLTLPEITPGVVEVVPLVRETFQTFRTPSALWQRHLPLSGTWTAWRRIDAAPAAPAAPASRSAGTRVVPLAVTAPGSGLSSPRASGTVRWVRSWAHAPRRVRVHVSNSNAANGTSGSSAALTGLTVAAGQADGTVTGVVQSRVAGAIPGAGQSLASEWLDTSHVPDGGRLAVSLSWSGATNVQITQGGCWTTADTTPAAATTAGWTRARTGPFHVWIEAEVPARAPVILAHGDSITVGTATTDPVEDSWAAQLGRRVGALPVILAQHGSSMASWTSGSQRWRLFDGFDLAAVVDAVVTTLGQNDLGVSGMNLPTLQSRHATMMSALREVLPAAPVFLGEITPSNKAATLEALRRDFNTWRATLPAGERGVIRWATIVGGGTDEDLAAQYSADGLHPNTAGQGAMAGVARTARVVPLTLTDAQMEALTA